MKIVSTLLATCVFTSAIAQTVLYNNGTVARMNPGCIVYVKNGDVKNNSGIIKNAGVFTIENNLINNDTLTAGNANGQYKLQGDFVNNHIFSANQGEVLLYGGNQQITGTSATTFYNLSLTGTGIKSQTIDARVSNTLDLANLELATAGNTMHIDNTATNAIINNGGFVSSTGNGRLAWNTSQSSQYLFPVGSSQGTPRIRPVRITPTQSVPNTYAVRLANNDPTLDGYNRATAASGVCGINDKFYHLIDRLSGTTSPGIVIYYDDATDGTWSGIGHWQNQPRWENTSSPVSGTSGNYELLSINNWSNFSYPAFALINFAQTPAITAQGNTLSASPAGISYQWYLNGDIISGATSQTYTASITGTYTVIVNYGNGCNGQSVPIEFSVNAVYEINGLSSFIVYPNPGSDLVYIKADFNAPVNATLHITNALGQQLLPPVQLNNTSYINHKLDVSQFANGVYFIRLLSENGQSSLPFIKN